MLCSSGYLITSCLWLVKFIPYCVLRELNGLPLIYHFSELMLASVSVSCIPRKYDKMY
uniref:Uncharacterized protein n=1 Tax=Arundo donax TaxID=35708 RepID=A0A0A9HWT0_ARUDO